MKIAIFDGIQETHLSLSLERALTELGHEVLNTQKINHGFLFEKNPEKLELLGETLQQVVNFQADWMVVFRPASLPTKLLQKIKESGVRLAVWLSDDPVLYDLIYGPVLAAYDLVLHCGNERVLEFYQSEFGRPTGVNFPFWTDNIAFPYVFGAKQSLWNIMFLGNVHDMVRRKRYFELAQHKEDIKHFGNSGTDFLGISGGFLDTDEEVVAAASHSKTALSIPQYFRDHRGMATWFPGLDKLGFFEYPSRIVQYMAMGLPVLNVTTGRPQFEAFPEMMVFDSVAQAVGESKPLFQNADRLSELSQLTHARFEHSFSSMCRAKFLVELFADDSWKTLSPKQRANLFTEFKSDAFGKGEKHAQDLEPGKINQIDLDRISSFGAKNKSVEEKPNTDSRRAEISKKRWLVFGLGWTDTHSAVNTVVRCLKSRSASVVALNPASCKNALQKRGDRIMYNIDVTKLNVKFSPDDVLVVCGIDAVLTEQGKNTLEKAGVRTLFFDPKPSNDLKRVGLLVDRFGYVFSSNFGTVALYEAAGKENIGYFCSLLEDEYLSFVTEQPENDPVKRIRRSKGQEEFFARCFEYDLDLEPLEYSKIEKNSRDRLARLLRTKLTFLTLAGKKGFPILPPWFGLALAQSECLVTQRAGADLFPAELRGSLIEVGNYGEIESKMELLMSDEAQMRTLTSRKDTFLRKNCSVSALLAKALGSLESIPLVLADREASGLDNQHNGDKGGLPLPPSEKEDANWESFEVSFDGEFSGSFQDVAVEYDGHVIGTFRVHPGEPARIALRWQKAEDRQKFTIRFIESVLGNEHLRVLPSDVEHSFVTVVESPSLWIFA